MYLLGDSKPSEVNGKISHCVSYSLRLTKEEILLSEWKAWPAGQQNISVCHSEAESILFMTSVTRTRQVKEEGDWVVPGLMLNAKFI